MPLLPLSALAAFLAFSALLAGCHGTVVAPDDPLRLRSDTLFIDTELGFTVALPEGWMEYGRYEENAGLDFLAKPRISQGLRNIELRIAHGIPTGDTGSLAAYVAARSIRDRPYDSVGIAVEMRAGVEVARAEVKDHWSTIDSDYIHRERWRDLYFRRFGRIVWIRIEDHPDYFDTNADLRFIDSSLTFF